MKRTFALASSFVLAVAPLTSVSAQDWTEEQEACFQDCKDAYPMGGARIQCKIDCIEGGSGGGQTPPPPPPGQCTTPATGWCSWN